MSAIILIIFEPQQWISKGGSVCHVDLESVYIIHGKLRDTSRYQREGRRTFRGQICDMSQTPASL